jgi:hypothetical protein
MPHPSRVEGVIQAETLTPFLVLSQTPTPFRFPLICEPAQYQFLNLQAQISVHLDLIKLANQ